MKIPASTAAVDYEHEHRFAEHEVEEREEPEYRSFLASLNGIAFNR
jgi:hypothetical protein